MMTFLIITVLALIALGIYLYIRNTRERETQQEFDYNQERIKDHPFVYGRIKGRVKNAVITSISIDDMKYDDLEDLFSRAKLTRKEHKDLTEFRDELIMHRNKLLLDTVMPDTHLEFRKTPVGDVRIYHAGALKLSPRFLVVLDANEQGQLVMGKAIFSESNLETDLYKTELNLDQFIAQTDEEKQAKNQALYTTCLNSSKYKKEREKFEEVEKYLAHYDQFKEAFRVKHGQLIIDGDKLAELVASESLLPVNEEYEEVDPEEKAYHDIDQLIKLAPMHK